MGIYPFLDNYVPTWELLPPATFAIVAQRNAIERMAGAQRPEERVSVLGLNYSIILNSACMIEGCLDLFLKVTVKVRWQNRNVSEAEMRSIDRLMKRISRATWSKYKSLFEVITDKPLFAGLTGQQADLIEDIETLFAYRNMLGHGESRGMRYRSTFPDVEFDQKGEFLKDFCRRRQLKTPEPKDGGLIMETFLFSEVADYFFSKSREFISSLSAGVQIRPNPILSPKRIERILAPPAVETD